MKRITITLILILALTAPAHAGEWFSWDETNTKLHCAVTGLMVIDLGQTLWAHDNYWVEGGRHEDNAFLDKYPSKEEIREYFALSYFVTTGLTYVLPPEWSHGFQSGVITMEVIVVNHNYSLGIGVKF